jgi:hypothetical protein
MVFRELARALPKLLRLSNLRRPELAFAIASSAGRQRPPRPYGGY